MIGGRGGAAQLDRRLPQLLQQLGVAAVGFRLFGERELVRGVWVVGRGLGHLT